MPKCKLVAKSAAKTKVTSGLVGSHDIPNYVIQDNQDGSFTVFGEDAGGQQVPIDSVATLTPAPTSSDPATVTVDAPEGMTCKVHGLKIGHADLTVTAAWNDGSIGPFTIALPCDSTQSPVTGLAVTLGTPTIR